MKLSNLSWNCLGILSSSSMQMIFGLFSCRASSILFVVLLPSKYTPFLDSKIPNIALLCEGVDCFAEATNTIETKAGNHRTISLSLCNDCVCKFRNEKICHSQEYYMYTHLYRSLSLSKSMFFACSDLVLQNTFSTKVCTLCRQQHHQIAIVVEIAYWFPYIRWESSIYISYSLI